MQAKADFDERRRNACFGGGLEWAHGLGAGAGESFWQSRQGTPRATYNSTRVLGYWLHFA